jgi:nitroreductase
MLLNFFKFIPAKILKYIKQNLLNHNLKKAYIYDLNRYKHYFYPFGKDTIKKLLGRIIVTYHVIEKGLTMPEIRIGFGEDKILVLCELCKIFINKYGIEEVQLEHAIRVILEYEEFHEINNYKLNPEIKKAISFFKDRTNIFPCSQKIMTKDEYFKNNMANFLHFSNSRASVRNFTTENVSIESIINSLNLAKNAPSACNRQSWRTYIYTNQSLINKILDIQGGNRGFGYLTNKLIIITGELSVFSHVAERNQVFIDGGIYAMNLLYSLHYYKIAACILNCCHAPSKDKELRTLCNILDSEVFIVMIACGIPPNNFKITISKRYDIGKTTNFID